ncbi:putative ribonuclease H-like domain-containing protein [Tanacetum coccineum]
MPLWKDDSLFYSSSKDASNDEPQPSNDAEKKDDEGGIDDQERTENSAQDVNNAGPSINTAITNFNTGSLNINIVSPTVPTTPLESTYVDFFGDESQLDLSNIATTYLVPSTPNIRIHKDHSLDHVIDGCEECIYGCEDFVKEEVYVCQPLGFEDLEFPDKVYKRGQIDKTLFIKRIKSDILLVQVYVDDIIFRSTKKELYTDFEKLMHNKFQMSSMGELTFFLGLQMIQKYDGIFISQDRIEVKTGTSKVNTVSLNLVLLGIT